MIREINHDPLFLNQPSEPATAEDLPVARDLLETLAAHREECVGMAANMIGVRKNIIVVSMGIINMAMLNPVILDKKDLSTQKRAVFPSRASVPPEDMRRLR